MLSVCRFFAFLLCFLQLPSSPKRTSRVLGTGGPTYASLLPDRDTHPHAYARSKRDATSCNGGVGVDWRKLYLLSHPRGFSVGILHVCSTASYVIVRDFAGLWAFPSLVSIWRTNCWLSLGRGIPLRHWFWQHDCRWSTALERYWTDITFVEFHDGSSWAQ